MTQLTKGGNTYTFSYNGLGDVLGSVRQIADHSGTVTMVRSYDPYGNTRQTSGDAETDFGFTGEFINPSGLIYLRARYYDSLTGRFTTRDTWEGNDNVPASLNRFNYAHSNPVMNTDPSGQCAFAVIDTILCSMVLFGAVGGVVGATFAGVVVEFTWQYAFEGKCNCTDTSSILKYPRQEFVARAVLVGAALGVFFGAIAGIGAGPAIGVSLVGMLWSY